MFLSLALVSFISMQAAEGLFFDNVAENWRCKGENVTSSVYQMVVKEALDDVIASTPSTTPTSFTRTYQATTALMFARGRCDVSLSSIECTRCLNALRTIIEPTLCSSFMFATSYCALQFTKLGS